MKKLLSIIISVCALFMMLASMAESAVSITTPSLSVGTVGKRYDATLSATGATSYIWSLSGGKLPSGLYLNSSGQLGGTPAEGGTFKFTVTAQSGRTDIASKEFELTIKSPYGPAFTELWKNVYALERGKIGDSFEFEKETTFGNSGLICYINNGNANNGQYLDSQKRSITEQSLAAVDTWKYYKTGFTADGNTRLIIRAQVSRPGNVTFSINDDMIEAGMVLEDLNRDTESPKNGIPTIDIGNGLYQASAVLVAPKNNPYPDRRLPYPHFYLTLNFWEGGTKTSSFPMLLSVYQTPVALLHGLWGNSSAETFGINQEEDEENGTEGLWHRLERNGFMVYACQYDGNFGPSAVIPSSSSYKSTVIFRQIAGAFSDLNAKRIACTKMDFVCHSMGGLMTRQFIAADEGCKNSIRSYGNGMVRRVVTIATPHRGSEIANLARGIHSTNTAKMVLNLASGKWTGAVISSILRKLAEHNNMDLGAQALVDLSVASDFLKNLSAKEEKTSSNVIMHAIYGTIRNDLNEMAKGINDWIQSASPIGVPILFAALPLDTPLFTALLSAILVINNEPTITESFLYQLFNGLYGGDNYDMAVPEQSAHGDFSNKTSSRKDGLDYNHAHICAMTDVQDRVMELLRGGEENFQSFKSTATTGTWGDEPTVGDKINVVSGLEITVDRSDSKSIKLSNGATQDVVVTATATDETIASGILYMLIETSRGYKLFRADTSDGGKTFSVTLQFSEKDAGVMNVSCFAPGADSTANTLQKSQKVLLSAASDVEENSITVYVSKKPAQITVVPDIKANDVEELAIFNGLDTMFVNIGSKIAIPLFLKTTDGAYYNVSSTAMGISYNFKDSSIATVTEDGKLKGLQEGTTTLTATFMGHTATINVDVSDVIVVPIDEEHFPDANFRAYISKKIDSDRDGMLSVGEITTAKYMNLRGSYSNYNYDSDEKIKTLRGIEYFTSLTTLDCSYNSLTILDVSSCASLQNLNCSHNNLTSLNVRNCTALVTLECYNNSLITLDVNDCTALDTLGCYDNSLQALDVSSCTSLQSLTCDNNKLTSLNVKGCSALSTLKCYNNNLTVLNLGGCSSLSFLYCGQNNFANLTIKSSSLKELFYSEGKKSATLDVSGCTALMVVSCYESNLLELKAIGCKSLSDLVLDYTLVSLDVSDCTSLNSLGYLGYLDNKESILNALKASGCTALESLDCSHLPHLSELDVRGCTSLKSLKCKSFLIDLKASGCTALESLDCSDNYRLKELDVNGCTALKSLYCSNNSLTTLNVSGCTALKSLNCSKNNLTSLDVSKNNALTSLNCSDNSITTLDVNKNTALTSLTCSANNLTTLDMSKNTALIYLDCKENNLTTLDVSKNTKLSSFSLLCSFQNISGAKLLRANDDVYPYQFDFRAFISASMMRYIVVDSIKGYIISYSGSVRVTTSVRTSYDNGVARFAAKPTEVCYNYTVAGCSSKVMDVTINFDEDEGLIQTKPTITTLTLPSGKVGTAYSATLTATRTTPITWSASGLPKDMSCNDAGVISGTPRTSGTFPVTVTATNEAGSVSKQLSLTITAAGTIPTPTPAPVTPDEPTPSTPEETRYLPPSSGVEDILESRGLGRPKALQSSNSTIGASRDTSSLLESERRTLTEVNGTIAAVLPEMSVTQTGTYLLGVDIDANIPTGTRLALYLFPRTSGSGGVALSDAENAGTFYDDAGAETTMVPENHHVNVAVELTAGVTYAPVIAAVIGSSTPDNEDGNNNTPDSGNGEKDGSTSGSGGGGGGGCSIGLMGMLIFPLIPKLARRKK